ncbi:DUF3991 domain-containing protein [Leptotrichia sp. OH3620_COT-345]|uniref:toprim domain-containing protein n=1 Tax=Leptotrichia sp. OH3620_COT-345 TaxID=2491048 RepID=UPI000F64DB9D|nr:toprim domain-containing protein [Leptotrichia sp. OH3620_COT-345]RRD40349.1 DUF3991 domain-containing protein [Leptotrichia sp. OH3620_COT-345]
MNTNLSDINLKDLLEYMGESLIPHGRRRYKLKDHDSLILSGSLFVWNSKNIKGNYYDLLKNLYGIEGRKIFEKVEEFLEDIKNEKYKPSESNVYSSKTSVKGFSIKKDNLNKVINYLSEKRGINKKIVEALYKKEIIFLDERDNVNFTIRDIGNKIQGYDLVGTGESKFKRNTSSHYGFNITNNKEIKNLYIFEAAIDLLSYLQLNKGNVEENSRFLSISGVRNDIFKSYLSEDIESIYICTDNDEAGDNFYKVIKEEYSNLNIYREKSKNKDWNDDLKEIKNIEKENLWIKDDEKDWER